MTEKILPRPVLHFGDNQPIQKYDFHDWYYQLHNRIFFVVDEATRDQDVSLELADVITVCMSWLEFLGYDEEKRNKLFATINEANKNSGYFEEI